MWHPRAACNHHFTRQRARWTRKDGHLERLDWASGWEDVPINAWSSKLQAYRLQSLLAFQQATISVNVLSELMLLLTSPTNACPSSLTFPYRPISSGANILRQYYEYTTGSMSSPINFIPQDTILPSSKNIRRDTKNLKSCFCDEAPGIICSVQNISKIISTTVPLFAV